MATSMNDEWEDTNVGWGNTAVNQGANRNNDWDDSPRSGGFGQSNQDGDSRGFQSNDNRGFGMQNESGFKSGGRGGFNNESRGFGGGGRSGSQGFGRNQDEGGESRGFGRGGNRGFARSQDDGDGDRGFGRGGSRSGFGRNQDDGGGESRGFGRGGNRGGFGRNQEDGDGESRGFGRGGNRGYGRQQDDGDGESRGFGRGGSRSGFGRSQDDGNGESRGFGRGGNSGFGRSQDDGEGESRSFSRGGSHSGFSRNQDESGGRGFGGGRGFQEDSEGGRGFGNRGGGRPDGDEGDGEKPRQERYIPPEDPTDEKDYFNTTIQSGINFAKYDKIDVKVSGSNPPPGIQKFEDANLRPILLENVVKSGYSKPTPVQKSAIPIILSGRDLMACAQTGSGKTAAFLLPILHTLLSSPQECVVTSEGACLPQCIVLSPTRELTTQIFLEAKKFSMSSIIKCCVCYGGTSTYHQTQSIMRGCHVLVATPGRMHDLVNRGRLSFDSVRFVVLDEADRMLDMGFRGEIEKMMNHSTMPASGQRQTLMFSATFPNEIQCLAANFLSEYLFLTVGIVGGANNDVEQNLYQVSKFEKRKKLKELLEDHSNKKAMVFVETKRNADFIAAFLSESGLLATSIHGDRLQREREEALKDFRQGRMKVLVATAVAARGLDIKNVEYVVNYDLPKTIDEYVHRIGRTGRVGNQGLASSLYDPEQDKEIAGDLVKCLSQAEQNIPEWLLQEAGSSISSYNASNFGGSDVRKMGGGAPAAVAPPVDEEW